ncbi:hypothetical protein BU26DRAFT_252673 [Trematosphaeria pertusa]|uniref:Uncharacterized protein n=1 Tax=Trematosphaeria pertusa TaxID=390896 RepID=A0A6A6IPL4_9PLEO|nr:uncharacterized protein BU26DRAFT_252673 [Trematosphaeria pertusa]KAF2252199.1 hypothetical protein BU26DRAFT_252673 [Trematosphaeria pertusa]
MAPRKKNKPETTTPEIQQPAPQRPSLLRRIQVLMPSVPRRRSTPSSRPFTAPNFESRPGNGCRRRDSRHQDGESSLTVPVRSDSPCPYDAEEYHSFPSIDKPRCWTCGFSFRRLTRTTRAPIRPCSACRSRSPSSHLARNRSNTPNRSASAVETSLMSVSEEDVDLPPRPVFNVPRVLLENGPRIARMPRFPPLNSVDIPRETPTERPPTRHGPIPESERGFTFEKLKELLPPPPKFTSSTPRPKSPKIHHIHGLPHARDYPYVHKHEVEKHLAALRAGEPTPVADIQRGVGRPHTAVGSRGSSRDYSETVFYGRGASPVSTASSRQSPTQAQPHSSYRSSPLSLDTILEENRRPRDPHSSLGRPGPGTPVHKSESVTLTEYDEDNYDLELQRSTVYRVRVPQNQQQRNRITEHESDHSSDHSSDQSSNHGGTLPPTPSTIGGVRTELRGGNPFQEGLPRLRGGGDEESPEPPRLTRSYKLKKFILTCRGPCATTSDSDSEDVLPPRTPLPDRIARATSKALRRVPLPKHIQRLQPSDGNGSESAPLENLRLSSLEGLNECPPTPLQQIPCLRGGGAPTFEDTDPLPLSLWWLAGGRGKKPITVAQWNSQKPKKRMGGLLGMAVFGLKAGTPYQANEKGDAGAEGAASGGSSSSSSLLGSSSSLSKLSVTVTARESPPSNNTASSISGNDGAGSATGSRAPSIHSTRTNASRRPVLNSPVPAAKGVSANPPAPRSSASSSTGSASKCRTSSRRSSAAHTAREPAVAEGSPGAAYGNGPASATRAPSIHSSVSGSTRSKTSERSATGSNHAVADAASAGATSATTANEPSSDNADSNPASGDSAAAQEDAPADSANDHTTGEPNASDGANTSDVGNAQSDAPASEQQIANAAAGNGAGEADPGAGHNGTAV